MVWQDKQIAEPAVVTRMNMMLSVPLDSTWGSWQLAHSTEGPMPAPVRVPVKSRV